MSDRLLSIAAAAGAKNPDALLGLFFFAWRGFAAEPDAILAQEGLGRVHHRVLYAVVRVPGIRVGDLAATLGVTRQALHRPLAELQKRRLVVSSVSEASARERELRATPRGALLEDKASGAQREQLRRVFAEAGAPAASGWAKVMRALAAPVISRSPGRVGDVVQTRRTRAPTHRARRG
jgi:DNA-binding MarR family transcriptional regulator